MPPEEIIAAPTPAPSPSPAPAPATKLNDPFSSLTAPKEAPKEPAPADAAADGKEPAKGQPAPAAPKDGKQPVVAKNSESKLQERVTQQNTAIATKDRELTGLRQQVQELTARGGVDTKALTASIESQKKEIERLQGELGAKDYTRHPDYITKYDKPFNDAAVSAKEIVESLTVSDADGNERPANWGKDFAGLYSLPRSAARLRAKELFGEDAPSVMQQYDDLHRLDGNRQKAVSEWQKNSTERETQTRSQQLQHQQKVAQGFEMVTKSLRENDPLFSENPADAEHSELWKKSQSIVDDAYFNRGKKTLAELVVLDSAIRLRAINEPILRSKLAKVEAELADYKARLDGKETSKNGSVRRRTDATGAAPEKDMATDLREALASAG